MLVFVLEAMSDGVVTIRRTEVGDAAELIAGRDGDIVGRIDFDTDRGWLGTGEVHIGDSGFAPHRGRG